MNLFTAAYRLCTGQVSPELMRGRAFHLLNQRKFKSLGWPLHVYPRVYVRNKSGISFGRNITLAYNCFISPVELKVGDGCWLGVNNFICGRVFIGHDVHLGPSVNLPGASHNIESELPLTESGSTMEGTILEDFVWVGGNSTILDGVKVGKGAVVAAGSVVTRDVPAFAVVAGVPARVLKYRTPIKEP
jgi:acetyltransferase-like isoleucine patch superfamily enzyme